jgi:saccharopepsin
MDAQFFGTITAGSASKKEQEQNFTVIFDTGSSNLWLPGPNCQDKACLTHKKFDPTLSNTFKLKNQNFSIKYGTGAVEGIMVFDSLSLGGVTIENQEFSLTTTEPGFVFVSARFDGIFGCGYSTISVNGARTPIENMIDKKLIKESLFAVYLSKSNLSEDAKGEISLGTINHDKYEGNIHWIPVYRRGYWEVKVDGVRFGETDLMEEEEFDKAPGKETTAAIDTGTSLIALPKRRAEQINKTLGAKQPFWGILSFLFGINIYTLDCARIPSLPNLSFIFAGKSFELTADEYIRRMGPLCITSFMPLDLPSGKDIFIIGDTFLSKYYSIYDFGNNRVGLATAKHE